MNPEYDDDDCDTRVANVPSTADLLDRYPWEPELFIDTLIHHNEIGGGFALAQHQRDFLRIAFAFDADGRLPWDTIVYSAPKKSGKTGFGAAVTCWWAFCHEAPNDIKIVANDLDQSVGRVFGAIAGMIKSNPILDASASITASTIRLSNDTSIEAIASEYRGSAGSNHGWTVWDELWGFTSEDSRRLWDELTPVPTRKNSVRFVVTYAGFENESNLLWDLYQAGVGRDEHSGGKGERLHPELPIYGSRAGRILVYWDHEARMPWQSEEYYASQKAALRPGAYLRLHENRWTASESVFFLPEIVDAATDATRHPRLSGGHIYVGVDAATKHDTAAVVSVEWEGDRIVLVDHRIWRPTPSDPIDLEATIESYLLELKRRHRVAVVLCDPWQLHRSITTLKNEHITIEEFPQTVANTTRMGQALWELVQHGNLRLYPSQDLRTQILNAVAIETPRGFRIAKEKTSKKIDATVALAMACVGAMDRKQAPSGGGGKIAFARPRSPVANVGWLGAALGMTGQTPRRRSRLSQEELLALDPRGRDIEAEEREKESARHG